MYVYEESATARASLPVATGTISTIGDFSRARRRLMHMTAIQRHGSCSMRQLWISIMMVLSCSCLCRRSRTDSSHRARSVVAIVVRPGSEPVKSTEKRGMRPTEVHPTWPVPISASLETAAYECPLAAAWSPPRCAPLLRCWSRGAAEERPRSRRRSAHTNNDARHASGNAAAAQLLMA
jgi:hypothetical protein